MIVGSNGYGLLLLVMLLGYGLVEVPLLYWHRANHETTLAHLAWKAVKQHEEVQASQRELRASVLAVETAAQGTPYHDPLRRFVDIIVAKVYLNSSSSSLSLLDTILISYAFP